MRTIFSAAIAALVVVTSAGAAAAGQPDRQDGGYRQDQRGQHADNGQQDAYRRHDEWRRGGRIAQEDWNRGQSVDWRSHHLRRPRSGYEWRQVDGNYVLAAAATGVIASMMVAHNR